MLDTVAVTGTVGLCQAIGFLQQSKDVPAHPDSGIFRVIDGIFDQFPVMMLLSSGVIALIGWYMLIRLIGARGQETRIEGSDSEIAIRRQSHGRIIHERAFPRSSVTGIRSFVTGSTNTTVMKRVELIVGEKAEPSHAGPMETGPMQWSRKFATRSGFPINPRASAEHGAAKAARSSKLRPQRARTRA